MFGCAMTAFIRACYVGSLIQPVVSVPAKLSERAPIAMSDDRMKELVLPTLRTAMSEFMSRYPEHNADELRIYFLAAPSATGAGEQVAF